MILLKLNLINRKISNFLKMDINALAWIFVGIITAFIITGTYLNHSNLLMQEYDSHFSTTQFDTMQNSIETTVKSDVKDNEKPTLKLIFILIAMWLGLWAWHMILAGHGPATDSALIIITVIVLGSSWVIVTKLMS